MARPDLRNTAPVLDPTESLPRYSTSERELADILFLIPSREHSTSAILLIGWNGSAIAFKACIRHSALCLGVLHKGLPYEASAHIFCHEHRDPGINADDVSVIPFFQRIEGINETVVAPGLRVTTS